MTGSSILELPFLPGEVSSCQGCHDLVVPLAKHPSNPVMEAEHPWEGSGVYYASVLFDAEQSLFRMWYYTNVQELPSSGGDLIDNAAVHGRHFLCYAESGDGLNWQKPELGIYEFGGSRDNNILFCDAGYLFGCATVIRDESDQDPARRYKMLFYDHDGAGRDGARTAVSADGLHWDTVGEFPILPTQDTPNLWHDRERGVFVAFLKDRVVNRRARTVSESADFRTWSRPRLQFVPDGGDGSEMEYYAQSAFSYGGRGLGFLNRYDVSTQQLDLELVYSPGGGDWDHLPSRPRVLAPGDGDAWDGGMVLPGMGETISVGDECWYYYYGSPARHSESGGTGAVGIARYTPGRLAGQQLVGEGWFSTLPFRCPGGRLTLNADSSEPLSVAAVGTGYGGEHQGFGREDCGPIQGDGTGLKVRWRERADVSELAGQYIRLAVYGRNARLYGATFET